jgi:AraC-like DNA-binding protein
MNLLFHPYGPVQLVPGGLPSFTHLPLPGADLYHTVTDFAEVQMEIISHDAFDILYSHIRPFSICTIKKWLPLKDLTSMLVLRGNCQINNSKLPLRIEEGEFSLFRPAPKHLDLTFSPAENISMFVTTYKNIDRENWFQKLPGLKKWMAGVKAKQECTTPQLARYSVLNAMHDVFTEQYQEDVKQAMWQLKLQASLLSQIADTFIPLDNTPITDSEKSLAREIKSLIEKDISIHITIGELSNRLNTSESSLKRAFHLVYHKGIYEHLRQLRMLKAKEMLSQGYLVKTVALSVGMRPSNFTSEFRKFFGFNASSLLR